MQPYEIKFVFRKGRHETDVFRRRNSSDGTPAFWNNQFHNGGRAVAAFGE